MHAVRMPDEVEACLGALGNLTAANSAQQRRCMQLADGANNHHNAVRASLSQDARAV